MNTVSYFQILALNNAQTSENRIHSDDIAAKYGFEGALVSGALLPFPVQTFPLSVYHASFAARLPSNPLSTNLMTGIPAGDTKCI